MLDNNTYNLMEQLTKENQSLWRIKNNYINDAGDCGECKKYWQELAKDKEEHIDDLTNLLKKYVK